jgi:hypothetical protein
MLGSVGHVYVWAVSDVAIEVSYNLFLSYTCIITAVVDIAADD